MPEFMCPLCGHLHSIRYYDPEDLPLDIEGVTKVGLGQGKGTKVVDRHSLLWDNDVSPKIVRRVVTLCRFFLDQKRITQNEVKQSLGLTMTNPQNTISLKEYNKLREDAEALKVQADDERKRGDAEHDRADNLQAKLNSQKVAIKSYNIIREDYESLRSQAEIEGRRADGESSRAANLQAMINSLQKKVDNLETKLENAKSSNSELRRGLEESETRVEEVNEVLDDLIETIENSTSYEFDPDLDSREEFIAEITRKLIEDNDALKADEENERRRDLQAQ